LSIFILYRVFKDVLIDCVSSKGYGIEKKNVAILNFIKNDFY